jgi:hypothetical protein
MHKRQSLLTSAATRMEGDRNSGVDGRTSVEKSFAMKHFVFVLLLCVACGRSSAADDKPPVQFAIIGLEHDHAGGFIPMTRNRTDVQLVGIVEARQDLVERYARRFKLETNMFFASLDELLAQRKVQAVATFTSTFDHRRVVEMCASRHIDVMMEKPLAVNMEHARAIEAAAKKGGVQIIVNYETTW